jgi:hypothetical protein
MAYKFPPIEFNGTKPTPNRRPIELQDKARGEGIMRDLEEIERLDPEELIYFFVMVTTMVINW